MRLNKFLAHSGIGSRRECDKIIQSKGVKVNGNLVKNPAEKISPNKDEVYFNNKKISLIKQDNFLILNKPPGYLTTSKDEFNRKTVYHLLPEDYSKYRYIGRLDYDSSGLVLFSNKPKWVKQLASPKNKIPKKYLVHLDQNISQKQLHLLKRGIKIKTNYTTKPAEATFLNPGHNQKKLEITLTEGKKRQIKRMFEALNRKVVFLKRIQFGPIKLGNLTQGKWRELNNQEIKALLANTK